MSQLSLIPASPPEPETPSVLELDLRSGALWREPAGEPEDWTQAWRLCAGLCAGRARSSEESRRIARERLDQLMSRWGRDFLSRPARCVVDHAQGPRAQELPSAFSALALMQKQAGRNPLARSSGPHWSLAGESSWRSGDFAPMWASACDAGLFSEPRKIKDAKKIGEALGAFASDKELFPFELGVARALFANEQSARAFFKEAAMALGWAFRGCLRAESAESPARAAETAELMRSLAVLWSENFAKESEGMWAHPARLMASWAPEWAPGLGREEDRRALWDALGSCVEGARIAAGPARGSKACASVCRAMTTLYEGQARECCWLSSLTLALAAGAGPSERDEYGMSPLKILAEASRAEGQADAAEYEALLGAAASALLAAGAAPNDLLKETPEQLARKIPCGAVRRAVLANLERDALNEEVGAGRGSSGRSRL